MRAVGRTKAVVCASALSLLIAIGLAAAPSALAETDMCNVGVTMSDGAVMRANVALPGPGRHPTVMVVDGYNKDLGDPAGQCSSYDENLTKAGFNVVVFDDRGTGSSDGTWGIWDARTQLDYRQELRWIERQPWQNGKIGTTGTSYLAITSLLVAETGDKHVRAVFANYPMADAYRDVTYFGGELDSTFMPFWFGFTQATNTSTPTQLVKDGPSGPVALNIFDHVVGGPAAVGTTAMVSAAALDERDEGIDSPYDNSEFRLMSPATRAGKIHAAVFWVGGWYDIFQRGEPYLFRSFTHTPAGGKVWVQGPTYHAATITQWSGLGYGASEEDTEIAWFEHWLRGAHNEFGRHSRVAPVNLWEVGANRWAKARRWPLGGTRWTSMYLSSAASGSANSLHDGSLTRSRRAANGSESMPFEAAGDLCSRSVAQWSAGAGAGTPCETNEAPSEATELTFTTPALTKRLHIAGPIVLNLWATLTKPDASFFAALTDVSGSTSTMITSGGLDAELAAVNRSQSWRNGAGQTILPWHPFTATSLASVPTGVPRLYQIEIFPTDWTLLAGHRLRLVVSTADTPHFTVPADRLAQMVGGSVTVLNSGGHRSSLLLPLQAK